VATREFGGAGDEDGFFEHDFLLIIEQDE